MDQLGNTERITEERGSEDQQPDGRAGEADASLAACTLAVYRADLGTDPDPSPSSMAAGSAVPGSPCEPASSTEPAAAAEPAADSAAADPAGTADADPATVAADRSCEPPAGYPDGFTGTLALQNLEAFDEQTVGDALGRVAHLISWAQAQQARLMDRMEEIFRDRFHSASGRVEPGMAFSLAAAECATILNVPQITAQRLMFEAGTLCSTHTATLTGLEEGRLSYPHAQVVLDQCHNVPEAKLPGFEADLLAAAEGQTRSQFSAKARRLREKRYPETISKRHLSAFEQRKVTLDREEDGMSCLSAHLRAEEAQQIYTTLTTAAQGERSTGDGRTTDQLRADILAQLLMGGFGSARVRTAAGTGHLEDGAGGAGWTGGVAGSGSARVGGEDSGGSEGRAEAGETVTSHAAGPDQVIVPRAEIMVLINAETLFGADDQPAELHGYGPISAEAARRLARNAVGWTGLAQDPHTWEILGVGRRRKVPAGLRRWLRARDGACRFPGCRVSTANADIDHTIDWAKGGPTDHGNLEHLCRRHHRFKTLGYWKACQPTPGVIEWTSPTGRVYRTEPFLELEHPKPAPPHPASGPQKDHGQTDHMRKDYVQAEPQQERPAPF